jgi:hypothetical protein
MKTQKTNLLDRILIWVIKRINQHYLGKKNTIMNFLMIQTFAIMGMGFLPEDPMVLQVLNNIVDVCGGIEKYVMAGKTNNNNNVVTVNISGDSQNKVQIPQTQPARMSWETVKDESALSSVVASYLLDKNKKEDV